MGAEGNVMSNRQLTKLELDELASRFQLMVDKKSVSCLQLFTKQTPSSNRLLCMEELLEQEHCTEYLRYLCAVIGAPSLAVAASQFAKRYAALLVVPALYTMSIYDKALDVSLKHVQLYNNEQQSWKPSLILQTSNITPVFGNTAEERRDWYFCSISQLFLLHLAPLWRSLALASSVSPIILWENTAVRIYSLFERKIAKLELPNCKKEQAQADYAALLALSDGANFGESYNPVARFRTSLRQRNDDSGATRMRHTCCFYYLTTGSPKYCDICPRAMKK